ncbi:MAG: hypothetical protein ACRDDY_08745 [Clostridium sp.]
MKAEAISIKPIKNKNDISGICPYRAKVKLINEKPSITEIKFDEKNEKRVNLFMVCYLL